MPKAILESRPIAGGGAQYRLNCVDHNLKGDWKDILADVQREVITHNNRNH